MTPALLVALILAVGWNVTLLLMAIVVKVGPFERTSSSSRFMSQFQKEIEIGVETHDLDIHKDDWKRNNLSGTASEEVHSRTAGTSRGIVRNAPYAEALVAVDTSGEEDEQRRCAVCLN